MRNGARGGLCRRGIAGKGASAIPDGCFEPKADFRGSVRIGESPSFRLNG
jgi:hypothetical protein